MSVPFFEFCEQSACLILIVSGIPLLTTSISGLVISILQAATQIQEQSISFLVKFVVASVTLAMCGGWFMQKLIVFSQRMFGSVAALGQL